MITPCALEVRPFSCATEPCDQVASCCLGSVCQIQKFREQEAREQASREKRQAEQQQDSKKKGRTK